MKKLGLIFLIIVNTVGHANSIDITNKFLQINSKNAWFEPCIYQFDFIVQDQTEVAFDAMLSELTRVHKAIYSLPYEFSFIKNTIMVEIEKNKALVSPHFPNRSSYGEDAVLGRSLFKEWYMNYPSESKAYIQYVEQVYVKYSK